MSESEVSQNRDNLARKNKWTLVAIIVMSLLPITAAYFMYFTEIGVPQDTVNNGMLFPEPVHVKALFESDDHQVVRNLQEDKKFRIFLPVGENCAEDCRENFYTTRQVHIRLNEKSVRLERYAINIAGLTGQAYLNEVQAEHPKLKTAEVSGRQWRDWITQSGVDLDLARQHYYILVSQEGWTMMYYSDQHGNLLLKDLKRAFKYTIDYQN